MLLAAETETKFQHINLNFVAAIGTYDDSNGKYFTLNFSITGGQDITWKYESKEKRDSKLHEAQKMMNNK
ncbi:MAG TPA: hypothetical protein PKE39_11625 [Ignavibacteria bacterium]|nr:hypothetical protein [Ignavibacteria bacterium]HMQ99663.1 hypothetical protein [Ignavibacteria bacterium]